MGEKNTSSSQLMCEISPTDTGDDTQKRFRYQHTATAYYALRMYMDTLPYTELLCEHHEDILAIKDNGKFDGIQIKTQNSNQGLFSLQTPSLIKSLVRFINLDYNYPDEFEKFVFAANCDFLDDESGKSPLKLKSQSLLYGKNINHKIQPNTLEKHILTLCDKSNKTREQVLSTIKKVTYQLLPSLDDIDSKIIAKTIVQIPGCDSHTVEICNQILDNLVSVIYRKSSRLSRNPIEDYKKLLSDDTSNAEIINDKRLTRQEVEQVLNYLTNPSYYLGTKSDSPPELKANRNEIMRKKMSHGMIDEGTINLMETLRDKSESYFIQSFYKNQIESEKYSHIQTLIWSEASEIECSVREETTSYGVLMLELLLHKLRDISDNHPEEVGNCPYQILKGQVGSLAGDCRIKFSKVPEAGWSNES